MTPVLREPLSLVATPKAWPPGIECIVDYNNSTVVMNDLRRVDKVVLTSISGLTGPDLQANAEKNPDHDGEQPLDATYGGRTITLTGYVESLNRDRMRALYSYLLDGFDDISAEYPLWFRWMDWRDPYVDSLALSDYAFDAGSATLQIASDGTGLQPTSTANKQLRIAPLKADGTVPTRFGYGDGEAIVKFRAGTALTGLAVGPEFRRASSLVKLRVIYEKATDTIRLYKVNTSTTQLASISATGLVIGTDYWLLVRAEGVNISYSLWSTYPPDIGGTPLFSGTFPLAGGDIALYPSTDTGMSWGLYWTPNSTTDRVSLLDVAAINPGDPIINCRKAVPIEGTETQTDTGWRRDFMITLRASDARMVSRKVTKTTITPPGTPVQQIYLSTFLTNSGRSPADMIIRFTGPYYNPSILFPGSGRILGVDASLNTSDLTHVNIMSMSSFYQLDTAARTVAQATLPYSAYKVLSSKSTWPQLLRGSNELRITADKFEDFYNGTNAAALNARVAAPSTLGTWTTSGTATDLIQTNVIGWGDSTLSVSRATTSDTVQGRIAVLGTTNYTDVTIRLLVRFTAALPTSTSAKLAILARYVDASNYFLVEITRNVGAYQLYAEPRVAGVSTLDRNQPLGTLSINTWYEISLTLRANGRYLMELIDPSTNSVLFSEANSYGDIDTASVYPVYAPLATAGALATGKIGILDYNPSVTAITRYYGRIKTTSAIDAGTIDVSYRHSSR